jgi:chromosome segregation ATPase
MRYILSLVLLLSAASSMRGAEVNPAEAKLREGLKNTMLQLRAVQTEKSALEAAKAELDEKVQTLTAQTDTLTKQLADDKAAAEKRIAELTDRVVARGNDLMRVQADLDKEKTAHKEADALAARKEAERAKVNSEKLVLERKVADQQARNTKMFEIGSEILSRYEKFGLGTAIAAREPFVGLTRIKLKNMFQELGDKLADEKIKP